jgi:PilZ domain
MNASAKMPETMNNSSQNSFSSEQQPERRSRPRIKVKVPIELFPPGSDIPERVATSDLSEIGCYIETMFPFPIGTTLEMSLQLEGPLLAVGKVVTCDPQVGNGIEFTKMLPEDQEELRAYVRAAQQTE